MDDRAKKEGATFDNVAEDVHFVVFLLVCICKECRERRNAPFAVNIDECCENCGIGDGVNQVLKSGNYAIIKQRSKNRAIPAKRSEKEKIVLRSGPTTSVSDLLDVGRLDDLGLFTSVSSYVKHVGAIKKSPSKKSEFDVDDPDRRPRRSSSTSPQKSDAFVWCPFAGCGSRVPKSRLAEHCLKCHDEHVCYRLEISNRKRENADVDRPKNDATTSDDPYRRRRTQKGDESKTTSYASKRTIIGEEDKKTKAYYDSNMIELERRHLFNDRDHLSEELSKHMSKMDEYRKSTVVTIGVH
jgi:hypothetical protein